jgi:FlaA1/EpsC-like NDP-sugar epimerase
MHGLRPGVDVEIKITGVRPGEKMHEELFCANTACTLGVARQPTRAPGIFRACNNCAPGLDELAPGLERLKQMAMEGRNGHLHQGIQAVLALQKSAGSVICHSERSEDHSERSESHSEPRSGEESLAPDAARP